MREIEASFGWMVVTVKSGRSAASQQKNENLGQGADNTDGEQLQQNSGLKPGDFTEK